MEKEARQLEVVMSWGQSPQSAVIVGPGQRVSVGDVEGASFLLPSEVLATPFDLVVADEEGFTIHAPAGVCAHAEREGDASFVDPLGDSSVARTLVLSPGVRAELTIGDFSFWLRETAPVEKTRPVLGADLRSASWIGASLAFHAMILGIFLLAPPNAGALSTDISHESRDYIRMRLDGVEQRLPDPEPTPALEPESGGVSGAPGQGEEGTAGAVEETRATGGGVSSRGPRAEDHRVPLTRERAAMAGVIGVATAMQWTAVTSPYGAADAQGFSAEDAYGNLMQDAGFSAGTGGLAMQGVGRGAGCLPGQDCTAGTVGVGGFGVGFGTTCDEVTFRDIERNQGHAAAVASCSPGGLGHGGGTGTGPMVRGDHRDRVPPPMRTGDPEVLGGLAREQIRRVVMRNRAQIRHCYEAQLQQRPDLQGRVTVRWTILQDGRVQAAQITQSATDLGSSEATECMTRAVSRWTFPAAPGVTAVSYPFVFQSQG